VGGGVLEQFHLIERTGDNAALAHDHSADGHLRRCTSARRLPQRLAHEEMVTLQINDRIAHELV